MKGRDKDLIQARDRKLFARYYYWTEVKRLRFDDALHILSTEEFFISESRIMQIIRKLINEGYEPVEGQPLRQPRFSGFKVCRQKPQPSGCFGKTFRDYTSVYHFIHLYPMIPSEILRPFADEYSVVKRAVSL